MTLIEELLNELWTTSVGLTPQKQLAVVVRGLYYAALECEDPRAGVWLELFKDLREVSNPVDWDKLKKELLETTRDAMDDAIDLTFDNYKRGA